MKYRVVASKIQNVLSKMNKLNTSREHLMDRKNTIIFTKLTAYLIVPHTLAWNI